jgi:peptidoglycan/xylan/chitin deacetylase (PgdA/CDA1 family)
MVWWRDDDIFNASDNTKLLLQFVKEVDIPIFCSIIPKDLSSEAITLLKKYNQVTILQHGYSHTNYAPLGKPYNEFGDNRSLNTALSEIKLGAKKLKQAFQFQFLPIFVPPWGNISENVIKNLKNIGFIGLSCIGRKLENDSNVKIQNVHIDIHKWMSNTEFDYSTELRSWNRVISDISKNLNEQNNGNTKYIGLLTHSQIMSRKDWVYFLRIIRLIKSMGLKFMHRDDFNKAFEK